MLGINCETGTFSKRVLFFTNSFYRLRFSTRDVGGELIRIFREHNVAISTRSRGELLLPGRHHWPRHLWERGKLLYRIISCILLSRYKIYIALCARWAVEQAAPRWAPGFVPLEIVLETAGYTLAKGLMKTLDEDSQMQVWWSKIDFN